MVFMNHDKDPSACGKHHPQQGQAYTGDEGKVEEGAQQYGSQLAPIRPLQHRAACDARMYRHGSRTPLRWSSVIASIRSLAKLGLPPFPNESVGALLSYGRSENRPTMPSFVSPKSLLSSLFEVPQEILNL